MNKEQISLDIPESKLPWVTKGIFSDHYILDRLPDSHLWPKEKDAEPIWTFCRELWGKRYIGLARGSEELTKKELLEPVLERLKFPFLPKARLPISVQQQEPDYLLLPDEETKDKIFDKDRLTKYSAAVTLIEAKMVKHPLSAPSKSRAARRFPHQQIREYLDEATDDTGKPFFKWAILTSGNLWRLYCRDARPGAYFEFDFEKALDSLKYFKIFIALFSPGAFVRDAEGKCPLDYLREEALEVQTELEDDLRKRVYVILTDLATGFYSWKENNITESQLDELYDNCLIFLYRLLFILYAEGRNLLPVKPTGVGSNKLYRGRYSLVRLLSKVKTPEIYFYEGITDLYKEILDLFHLINGNQPSRNEKTKVPQYNGGLFDYNKYHLLDKWRMEERTLAEVLRGLMYSMIPSSPGETRGFDFGDTIDYANLEVRQLGSIYEGLLEHHLVLEDQHLVLRGDKAERKATGTYYTPDYIVQYIVENTLQPLCDRVENSKKVQGALRKGVQDNSFAEGVLQLNVLDPAMGSGHFLVRATEFLADQIVYHPTTALQIEKVPRGISHEEAEIAFWRRRVVESCIYGVDLNPLAVELAKLSLWLTCISADQPLNFLDHHLRPGNSLIGAEIAYLGSISDKRRTKQVSLSFGPDLEKASSEAIKAIAMIEAVESSDLSIIKEKETWWEMEVHKRLQPYRDIADVWSASSFGLKIKDPEYQHLAELLVLNPKARSKEDRELKAIRAPHLEFLRKMEVKYLFHWELEFPEVFFEKNGKVARNAGFDAVIGNPPYDVLEKERKKYSWPHHLLHRYVKVNSEYGNALGGKLNLYRFFIVRSISLLGARGRFGIICPMSIIADMSCAKTRLHIIHSLSELLADCFPQKDNSNRRIFKAAKLSTVVLTGSMAKKKNDIIHVRVFPWNSFKDPFKGSSIKISDAILLDPKNIPIPLVDSMNWELCRKIYLKPNVSRLQNISDFKITRGEINQTIFRDYIKNNSNLTRLVKGVEIGRYCIKSKLSQGKREWFDESSFLKNYNSKAVVIQRRIALQRITGVDETNRIISTLINPPAYFADSCNSIQKTSKGSYSYKYLLGFLNSTLYQWRFKLTSSNNNVGTNELESMPFVVIDFSDPSDKARHDKMVQLVEQMLALHKKLADTVMENERQALQQEIEITDKEIDQLVYELYGLTEEEICVMDGSK